MAVLVNQYDTSTKFAASESNCSVSEGEKFKIGLVSQSLNWTSEPCCTLHEWLVFPLRGRANFYADAAFSTLRPKQEDRIHRLGSL
jgi:hypothetical protein